MPSHGNSVLKEAEGHGLAYLAGDIGQMEVVAIGLDVMLFGGAGGFAAFPESRLRGGKVEREPS